MPGPVQRSPGFRKYRWTQPSLDSPTDGSAAKRPNELGFIH